MNYNPLDWYWIVGGDGPHLPDAGAEFPPPDQVFSSQRVQYVPVSDATYQEWIARGVTDGGFDPTTRIDTVENLQAVLTPYGITVPAETEGGE